MTVAIIINLLTLGFLDLQFSIYRVLLTFAAVISIGFLTDKMYSPEKG